MPGEGENRRITLVLVSVLAILAGVAVLMAFRGAEEGQVSAPESADTYICLEDGHQFKLTPAEFEQLLKEDKVKVTGGMDDPGMALLPCPKCGKTVAVRAEQCPNDQTWFGLKTLDGKSGKCPKCGWSLHANR